jgi:Raf kinase inhibitor-like YbhB/YbcL family protein
VRIESPDFRDGGPIPPEYSRDGGDTSPPLTFEGVPPATKSLALTCDDPDAPGETWVHWVLFDLPPTASGLPPGVEKGRRPAPGGIQGKTSYGELGWGGPAPPRGHGTHHYEFRLYALDKLLGLSPGAGREEVGKAMKGHVLAEALLTGTYRRD